MSFSNFANTHRDYIRQARKAKEQGFSLKTTVKLSRVLAFLFKDWWKVDLQGINRLPKEGPAMIIGNAGGIIPWAGLMMLHALMTGHDHHRPRRLNILADMDWIEDERLYNLLREIGFVSWSSDNAKRLFAEGEIVIVFPEGTAGAVKPFGERYRVRPFDWTKVMPAIDAKVPIFPLATVGPDESFPVGQNVEWLAKFLDLPAFPVTPAFPFLPFPANLFSLPVHWKMRVLKPLEYQKTTSRSELEETSKSVALFGEGEVQAELNRLLRKRIKSLF